MKSKALVFWITLILVGSVAYGSWVAWRNVHPEQPRRLSTSTWQVSYPPAPPIGPRIKDFKLVERSGREFDSKELHGHVWVGSYFFASCPGPCWQQNQVLKGVEDEFKNTDLRLVSITCDPKIDTPEVLSKYAERFPANPYQWVFLTGDLDYIKRIGHDIFLQDVQEGQHRNSALVIDRDGKIRGSFDLLDPAKAEEMKKLIHELLAEKAEPAGDTPADGSQPEAANKPGAEKGQPAADRSAPAAADSKVAPIEKSAANKS
jgi:cytochrome oxidase Cu insertion factor (SCO1/SenC/PrrC family)